MLLNVSGHTIVATAHFESQIQSVSIKIARRIRDLLWYPIQHCGVLKVLDDTRGIRLYYSEYLRESLSGNCCCVVGFCERPKVLLKRLLCQKVFISDEKRFVLQLGPAVFCWCSFCCEARILRNMFLHLGSLRCKNRMPKFQWTNRRNCSFLCVSSEKHMDFHTMHTLISQLKYVQNFADLSPSGCFNINDFILFHPYYGKFVWLWW